MSLMICPLLAMWVMWVLSPVDPASMDIGQHPMVNIKQGRLSGTTMRSNSGQELEAFLGIPYGKVVKRFTKPEPGEPWEGILDATKDGPSCKQYQLLGKNSTSEDCLTLNIYTKKNFTEGYEKPLLPVLVYIYGGGFTGGISTSQAYGPGRYMDGEPIVLVLLNYRTGSFGFLSTGDDASPGNFGLLDQVMALQWIQHNIKAFGGDPAKVTISGESAGGTSVMLHMLSPLSKDLFHGAIAQSGHVLRPWVVNKYPLNITRNIAQKLDCPTETTYAMLECMRKVDADDLIIASNLSNISGLYSISSMPVIDGHFLTETPLTSLREGRFNKIPVITGITADESASIVADFLGKDNIFLKGIHEQNWGPFLSSISYDDFVYLNNNTVTKEINQMYFHQTDANKTYHAIVGEIEFASDLVFNSGNDKTVRLLATSGTPVFMYVFDYSSWDISATNITGRPDVSHTSELYLLFNRNKSSGSRYTNETEQVSKNMVNLWTTFVAYGNPTPSGPLRWSPVQPAKRLKYLNISSNLEMKEGYLTERMEFWNELLYDQM